MMDSDAIFSMIGSVLNGGATAVATLLVTVLLLVGALVVWAKLS
jgi:hypothetical protein